MTVTIYHNRRCSKSRQTLSLLEEKGLAPTVVEYLKTPPSKAEFRDILDKLGLRARDVLRAKEAKEEGIDPDALSDDALIDAMLTAPRVIERPIVVTDTAARLGRPPEKVNEIL